MLGKCLWVSAALVMLAVADPDSGAGPAVRTAEPGNWTVDNCIVLKMSAQVRAKNVNMHVEFQAIDSAPAGTTTLFQLGS
jgi:hypothetical protein